AQRVVPAALGGAQRFDEADRVAVATEQLAVVLQRSLDVVLEHRDDELVLAREVRVERAASEAGGGRDRLDARSPGAPLGAPPGPGVERLAPRLVARRTGAHP